MKKFLVVILAISMAFSCLSIVSFAEASEAALSDGTPVVEGEAKTVQSLVGAYYLQGESGYGYVPGGGEYETDYDYSIAANIAKAINGTNRVPFYAMEKDGAVYLDRFAQATFISEVNAAAAAGIDFIAYKYYAGYGAVNGSKQTLTFMNNQLKLHSTLAGQENAFEKEVDFAIVIDGDFNASKEAELIIDNYLVVQGYLTATDGRPVVFIEWNDDIANQITTINKKLKKTVADGANEKKTTAPQTQLADDVEKMYVVALNAHSYDEAIAAGCDAISWTEGAGSNGEAYTSMTANVEANWANGEKVIPNVVTGFDKTVLADNPIEVTMKKFSTDKETSVRYSRTGTASDSVAAATPEELVAHVTNAVATTNKPAEFSAIMMYAWDDFTGGAYLCPTKTDKANQYDTSYIKALRNYFYGKTDGFKELVAYDATGNLISTDETGVVTTTKNGEVISKVDADGKDLLNGGDGSATGVETLAGEGGSSLTIVIVAVAAVVVVAVVVVVIVVAGKKKKGADKAE